MHRVQTWEFVCSLLVFWETVRQFLVLELALISSPRAHSLHFIEVGLTRAACAGFLRRDAHGHHPGKGGASPGSLLLLFPAAGPRDSP